MLSFRDLIHDVHVARRHAFEQTHRVQDAIEQSIVGVVFAVRVEGLKLGNRDLQEFAVRRFGPGRAVVGVGVDGVVRAIDFVMSATKSSRRRCGRTACSRDRSRALQCRLPANNSRGFMSKARQIVRSSSVSPSRGAFAFPRLR